MKKILALFISLLTVIALCFTMVSCDDGKTVSEGGDGQTENEITQEQFNALFYANTPIIDGLFAEDVDYVANMTITSDVLGTDLQDINRQVIIKDGNKIEESGGFIQLAKGNGGIFAATLYPPQVNYAYVMNMSEYELANRFFGTIIITENPSDIFLGGLETFGVAIAATDFEFNADKGVYELKSPKTFRAVYYLETGLNERAAVITKFEFKVENGLVTSLTYDMTDTAEAIGLTMGSTVSATLVYEKNKTTLTMYSFRTSITENLSDEEMQSVPEYELSPEIQKWEYIYNYNDEGQMIKSETVFYSGVEKADASADGEEYEYAVLKTESLEVSYLPDGKVGELKYSLNHAHSGEPVSEVIDIAFTYGDQTVTIPEREIVDAHSFEPVIYHPTMPGELTIPTEPIEP